MSVYLQLTSEFNDGRLRAIVCSGQAVVFHRLAIMSKDGDWILREDVEALGHVLRVLEGKGATYRYGAPLDVRWMRGGWSCHFEFPGDGFRVRADFFTRPPRVSPGDLERMWVEQEGRDPPFTNAGDLARIKMTQREKDYPVIGELARLVEDAGGQLLLSRSPRDLCRLVRENTKLAEALAAERPVLKVAIESPGDPDPVAVALDAERRALMRADETRLGAYAAAAAEWRERWPAVRNRLQGLPLGDAHAIVTEEAEGCLPMTLN